MSVFYINMHAYILLCILLPRIHSVTAKLSFTFLLLLFSDILQYPQAPSFLFFFLRSKDELPSVFFLSLNL